MFSSPMNTCVAARARRLLDETRNAVAQRVDLQDERNLELLALAQFDQPVEDRLPIAVAREIVVGDEEPRDALAELARTIASTSSGVRWRDLRPCTLMMVQKLHWNGQPRPASKLE